MLFRSVTIYDGDDPSLPMWMVFDVSFSYDYGKMLAVAGSPAVISSVVMRNGKLGVGSVHDTYSGLHLVDFLEDKAQLRSESSSVYTNHGGISQRNLALGVLVSVVLPALVSNTVNDVAMTVLPDAPIDPATGLPVPTIAVATAGGVSVIKDDGTVVDITYTVKTIINSIAFDADNNITFVNGLLGTSYQYAARKYAIPSADIVEGDGASSSTNDIRLFMPKSGIAASTDVLQYLGDVTAVSRVVRDVAIGNSHSTNGGLTHLAENPATPSQGMVAYTTSTYNTGWMNGDIKGAFLSDTDDTDLVGSGELVTSITNNSSFSFETLTTSGSSISSAINLSGFGIAYATVSLTAGKTYVISGNVTLNSGTAPALRTGADNNTLPDVVSVAVNGGFSFTITPSLSTSYVGFRVADGVATDFSATLSVKLADADRSVNNNGLIVNGTVTRSAVATGAELVAYSGFSASNYLEQPYNSDLDFGTGDFCVMGWVKSTGTSECLLHRSITTGGIFIQTTAGGVVQVYATGSTSWGTSLKGTVSINNGAWHFVAVKRASGVLSISIDGVQDVAAANTNDLTYVNAVARFGLRNDGLEPWDNGSAALLRISATAPTAEQIARIYQDERPLFQENAACTIAGASDAVTALAHDSTTNLLHVGSSYGRSVFQGLRRVDAVAGAVGTAISAENGLVVSE